MKKSYSCLDFNDSAQLPLGSSYAEFSEVSSGGHLEITMTHPLDNAWLKKTSEQQKRWFCHVFNEIKPCLTTVKESQIFYEFHTNGNIHAHAVCLLHNSPLYPIGLVSDFVKLYLKAMPKRYNAFSCKCLHYTMNNYCSNQIKVQYMYKDQLDHTVKDKLRYDIWLEYCNKN